MNVVIPLSTESAWDNNEIRYTLRALERNLLDLDCVFICGAKPAWIKDVVHLPTADRWPNRDANTIDALLVACKAGVGKEFLRCSDDEVLLRPYHSRDILPWHAGDVFDRPPEFWAGNRWLCRLRATGCWLRSKNFSSLIYDTHTPKIYDRDAFLRVMPTSPYWGYRGMTIETCYFNQVGTVSTRLADQRAAIYADCGDAEKIKAKLSEKTFLNYDDTGLTLTLKQVLEEIFPTPSHFEAVSAPAMPPSDFVIRNLGICHKCRERPAGCWKVVEYGCHQEYMKAARHAAETRSCPIGKLN